jgi:ElaB/YqjD/DUF883 family membrane-anchored ribosome-binding protein
MDEAELKMATAKKPGKSMAKEVALAKKYYKNDVKALHAHAKQVKKQVDTETVLLKKRMKQEYHKAIKTYKKTKKSMIKKKDKTKHFIQEHPFLSIAAAATAGALLAKLLRKR